MQMEGEAAEDGRAGTGSPTPFEAAFLTSIKFVHI